MGNQQVTDTPNDLKWLTGIIDGEGTISANYRVVASRGAYVNVWLSIPNTDPALLQRVIDAIQDLGETPHIVTPTVPKKGHSRWWKVELKGMKRLQRFLPKILDELTGDKQEVAQKVLQLCNARLDHRGLYTGGRGKIRNLGKPLSPDEVELLQEIKDLNKRGNGHFRDYTFALRKKEDIVQSAVKAA